VPDTVAYLFIGLVAALVTFFTTPLVTRRAHEMGWVVQPDERRVHRVPTPDVGGIAMVLGFVAALLLAWQMDRFSLVFDNNSEPFGVLIAAAVIFGTGLIDDVRELSSPAKITGTVIAGLVLVWFGATMFYFRIPFLDVFVLSDDWIPIITVLWLVGMTQAINLIDGLDGLAAGIVAIAAAAFFLYSRRLDDLGVLAQPNIGPLIAVIALGVCVGFLPHNFNPAKIFMGDSGALFLGLLMAVSTSVVGGRADPNNEAYTPGRSDPRHRVRHRSSSCEETRGCDCRQRPPSSPLDGDGSWTTSKCADPVALDGTPERLRSLSDLHRGANRVDPHWDSGNRSRFVHRPSPRGSASEALIWSRHRYFDPDPRTLGRRSRP
jgi:UDP-N-acetylmuramyl pentapeptide phosphotransferase/UDP-N-acetylglucosamine-1-phosphate transferase